MSSFGRLLEFLTINSSHAIERLLNSSALLMLFVHSLCIILNFRQGTRIERAACPSNPFAAAARNSALVCPVQWYEACLNTQCLLVP